MTKIYSGIMGLVVGDALGVPVEFKTRDSFHVTDMIGYGTYNMPPGTWSDDSSMTLATVESIARLGRINTDDIMQNFYRWTDENAFTPYGELFDIGRATREAIQRYAWGTPARKCGGKAEWDNGNGSLMCILPLAFTDCRYQMVNAVSSLTHAHEISLEACRIYISVARKLLRGKPLAKIVKTIKPELPVYERLPKLDTLQRDEIKSSGWLLYPNNQEMNGRSDISFSSNDGINVRVFFVDVANIEESLEALKMRLVCGEKLAEQ